LCLLFFFPRRGFADFPSQSFLTPQCARFDVTVDPFGFSLFPVAPGRCAFSPLFLNSPPPKFLPSTVLAVLIPDLFRTRFSLLFMPPSWRPSNSTLIPKPAWLKDDFLEIPPLLASPLLTLGKKLIGQLELFFYARDRLSSPPKKLFFPQCLAWIYAHFAFGPTRMLLVARREIVTFPYYKWDASLTSPRPSPLWL